MFYFLSKKKIRDKKFGQKLKMKIFLNEKFGKLYLHTFQNIAHLLGQRQNSAIIEGGMEGEGGGGGGRGGGVCMSFFKTGPMKCMDVPKARD